MAQEVHYKAACRWLKELRAGTSRYADYLKYMAEDVEQGRYTLDELGTSEAELEELRKQGCLTAATEALGELRAGPSQSPFTKWELQHGLDAWQWRKLVQMSLQLSDGGFTLADAGTSTTELKHLCGACAAEELNEYLSR